MNLQLIVVFAAVSWAVFHVIRKSVYFGQPTASKTCLSCSKCGPTPNLVNIKRSDALIEKSCKNAGG